MGHGGDGALDTCGAMLDRSRVHILLCDKDPGSGLQVMKLLQKCSYQVTCVKSASQVMEVLDSSGNEVDLILAEVELPKEKGFKLLKHIIRQEQLQHIPVVMMSLQDEMALVVRCLKLGAVDFLLKPLRRNELLNLWTHTWRRRRMLGLTEKHLMKGNLRVPLDLLVSETSESNNTNSTNLFSDDMEDHKAAATMSMLHPTESEMSPRLELSLKPSVEVTVEVTSEHGAGSLPSPPRKSELKIGQSSAFLTYNKLTNHLNGRVVEVTHFDASSTIVHSPGSRPDLRVSYHHEHEEDGSRGNNGEDQEPAQEHGQELGNPPSDRKPVEEHVSDRQPYPNWTNASCRSDCEIGEHVADRQPYLNWANASCRSDCEIEFREPLESFVPFPGDLLGLKRPHVSDHCTRGSATSSTSIAAQFLAGGMIGSVMHCPAPMIPPAVQIYQSLPSDDGLSAGIAAGIPSVPLLQGLNVTSTFPFYPFGLHVATAPQLGAFPGWPPALQNPVLERKLGHAERREAALNKFRLKRKDRCFEKKIRYVSRKKLAEQRPRVRGQFVRRENDTDLNDMGVVDDYDDEDDQGVCDLGDGSSPESVAEDG